MRKSTVSELPCTEFAPTVLLHRRALGISQEYLGKIIGVTGTHVCRIETGRQIPSMKVFWQLCVWMELDAKYVKEFVFQLAVKERKPYR